MTSPITAEELETARSLLFVPGDRADRFDRAAASAADAAVLDLEDAVAPRDKATARDAVVRWLAAGNRAVVRCNPPGTPWHADDLRAVRPHRPPLLVPKSEEPSVLAAIATELDGAPLLALVETARGIGRVRELCAVRGVTRVAFGNIDLAAQLGIDPQDRLALLHARSALVFAAAEAGLPGPLDGVSTAVRDVTSITDDAAYAASLGMTGKLCIHPAQVAAVHDALRPEQDVLAWAHEVVTAAQEDSVVLVRGAMVDRPVVERARRLLTLHGSSEPQERPLA